MNYKQYAPGIHKLIHHTEHLKKIMLGKVVAPLHVSVWPTIKCQCTCSYCCCRKTENRTGEIPLKDFKKAIKVLAKYGTKAIEFSGGGEPTLWTHFVEGVDYAYKKGMKLSLITNGITLAEIPQKILRKFSWVRISIQQSMKHAKSINSAVLRGVVRYNFSFIVTEHTDLDVLGSLYAMASEEKAIVRIAVQRPSTEAFEDKIEKEMKKYPYFMFFSKKESGPPLGCYMAWVRAAIDWRGMFLPCPSMQLNCDSEGKIPESFPLCHIKDLKSWLKKNTPHDLGYRCNFCNCGKEHNDFINKLIAKQEALPLKVTSEVEDVDFV